MSERVNIPKVEIRWKTLPRDFIDAEDKFLDEYVSKIEALFYTDFFFVCLSVYSIYILLLLK